MNHDVFFNRVTETAQLPLDGGAIRAVSQKPLFPATTRFLNGRIAPTHPCRSFAILALPAVIALTTAGIAPSCPSPSCLREFARRG